MGSIVSTENKRSKAGIAAEFVALILMWGSFAAVSKLILKGLESFQVLFYIFVFAFIAMTLLMLFKRSFKEIKKLSLHHYIFALITAVPSFLYYFLYTLSLKHIPALEATTLNYLYPLVILVLAVPVNRERFSIRKLISVLLGLSGMVLIITNGNLASLRLTNLAGDLLSIGAAIAWGLFSVLGKKSDLNAFIAIYIYTAVSLLLSTIVMIVFSGFVIPDLPAVCGLAWLGASNIVLCYFLWFRLLRVIPASHAGSLSLLTPFVSLIFIAALLGEPITYVHVIGLAVIVLGAFIPQITLNHKQSFFRKIVTGTKTGYPVHSLHKHSDN